MFSPPCDQVVCQVYWLECVASFPPVIPVCFVLSLTTSVCPKLDWGKGYETPRNKGLVNRVEKLAADTGRAAEKTGQFTLRHLGYKDSRSGAFK